MIRFLSKKRHHVVQIESVDDTLDPYCLNRRNTALEYLRPGKTVTS